MASIRRSSVRSIPLSWLPRPLSVFSSSSSSSCCFLHPICISRGFLHSFDAEQLTRGPHASSVSSSSGPTTTRSTSAAAAAARPPSPSSSPPTPPPPPLSSSSPCLDYIGSFQSNWLHPSHPYRIRDELYPQLRSRAYLPNFSDYMSATPYEALLEVASSRPYHDVLQLIMEQSFFFLIQELGVVIIGATDAPLPHVIYEDVMKVFTFSSLQNPPEEHFQLSSSFRFLLLSKVAEVCRQDNAYLFQARRLFRKMEQQQSLTSEDYALMVWIYAAARDTEACLHLLVWMAELSFSFSPQHHHHRRRSSSDSLPLATATTATKHGGAKWGFSPKVFAQLQHPFADVCGLCAGHLPHVVKGLLWQQRLAQAWSAGGGETGAVTTAYDLARWNNKMRGGEGGDDDKNGASFSSSASAAFGHLRRHPVLEKEEEEGGSSSPPLRSVCASLLPTHPNTFAIGVHAVFMHYVLTQQFSMQWKWLEMALKKEATTYWSSSSSSVEQQQPHYYLFGETRPSSLPTSSSSSSSRVLSNVFLVSSRTLRIALGIFIRQQGQRCPPSTVKELFLALVRRGGLWGVGGRGVGDKEGEGGMEWAEDEGGGIQAQECSLPALLLFMLMRVRRNECFAYAKGRCTASTTTTTTATTATARRSRTSSSSFTSSCLEFSLEEVAWVTRKLVVEEQDEEAHRRSASTSIHLEMNTFSPSLSSTTTFLSIPHPLEEEEENRAAGAAATTRRWKNSKRGNEISPPLDRCNNKKNAEEVPQGNSDNNPEEGRGGGGMEAVEQRRRSGWRKLQEEGEEVKKESSSPPPLPPSVAALALPLIRGLMTSHGPSTPPVIPDVDTEDDDAILAHRMASWRALLQRAATFGRELLQEGTHDDTSSLTPPSAPPRNSSSSSSFLTSHPVALAHARVLFRELAWLDKQGLPSRSSSSSTLGASTVVGGEEVDENVQHVRQKNKIETTLQSLQKQGATDSQQYYTRQVLEEEEREQKLYTLLTENPTALWTQL